MIRPILIMAVTALTPGLSLAQEAEQEATADTAATFSLELNNAATLEGDICQLTYVATNGSDEDLAQASFQVGFFDGEGIVRRIVVLDFGALPPGKTRIVPFNLPEQSCEDLSRIIVNDIAQCSLTEGETSDVCGTNLQTSSRTDIQFGL